MCLQLQYQSILLPPRVNARSYKLRMCKLYYGCRIASLTFLILWSFKRERERMKSGERNSESHYILRRGTENFPALMARRQTPSFLLVNVFRK
jgi:hypothetical protein